MLISNHLVKSIHDKKNADISFVFTNIFICESPINVQNIFIYLI